MKPSPCLITSSSRAALAFALLLVPDLLFAGPHPDRLDAAVASGTIGGFVLVRHNWARSVRFQLRAMNSDDGSGGELGMALTLMKAH
jgi:hypothetical protein